MSLNQLKFAHESEHLEFDSESNQQSVWLCQHWDDSERCYSPIMPLFSEAATISVSFSSATL